MIAQIDMMSIACHKNEKVLPDITSARTLTEEKESPHLCSD